MSVVLFWIVAMMNCDGSPTADIRWVRAEAMVRKCVNADHDSDDPIAPPTCDPPVIATTEVDVWITSMAIPIPTVPEVGQMSYWRLDQIDGAGNSSKECE